jgi:hypothetical protein
MVLDNNTALTFVENSTPLNWTFLAISGLSTGSLPQWKGTVFKIKTTGQKLYGVATFQTTASSGLSWELWNCNSNGTAFLTKITNGVAPPDSRPNWYSTTLATPIDLVQGNFYCIVFHNDGYGYQYTNNATDGVVSVNVDATYVGYDGSSSPSSGLAISGNPGPYNTQISIGGTSIVSAPNVNIISVDHYKVSNKSGINQCHVTFKFDTDIMAWAVNTLGTSWDTGTLADFGGIIMDSFNRSDNNTSLGIADTSQSWNISALGSALPWGILGNKAYSTDNVQGVQMAYLDGGISDNFECSVDMTWASYTALMFRYMDSNNMYFARISTSGLGLFRNINNSSTQIGNAYSFTPVNGQTYNVRIVVNGSSYQVYLDGTQQINGTDTDTTLNSYTKFGFRTYYDNTSKFDNFRVSSLSTNKTAGTNITAIIDYSKLYQEGDNRINIYGKNSSGWTPYNQS